MREVVSTKNAPRPIGPYSQAIRTDEFLFLSGQAALDPSSHELIDGDIAAQTERALKNLAAVLAAAGSGLDRVVKTTVFLKNMDDFDTMNEVYARFFPSPPPARSTVQVARLPKDALVEIELVALA